MEEFDICSLHDEIENLFLKADFSTSKQEKGKYLEDILELLLTSIPGIEMVERNINTNFDNEEVDVCGYNNQTPQGLPFFPFMVFVECKNWSSPVGSSEIRDFTRRLQRRGCNYGIMVAANGITGNPLEFKSAQNELSSALQDGIRILVVTRRDLLSIQSISDFVVILKRKLCQLTLYLAVSND